MAVVTSSGTRVPLALLVVCLALQTAAAWLAIGVLRYPMSTQRDSWEYVNITDNVIRGHGFSVEPVAPWRPDSIRTPGMLLTNIPLRLFFPRNDGLAAVFGRIWLLASVILVIRLAREMGLSRDASNLAGVFLILMPTVAYYSILVYETETPYLIACCVLALGLHRAISEGRSSGFVLIALGSAYAISLRPAALIVLAGLVALASVGVIASRGGVLRRRLSASVLCVLVGSSIIYCGWSLRNRKLFGVAEYSAIVGVNLLQYNAAAAIPYLGPEGQSEIAASVERLKLDIHSYYGRDQLVRASLEKREGLRLIRKYWKAFVQSHIAGTLRSALFFDVSVLRQRYGALPGYVLAVEQGVLTLSGLFGLVSWARALPLERRVALALILAVGLLSVASAGAVASPRFRFPLEIPLALGNAWLAGRLFIRNTEVIENV